MPENEQSVEITFIRTHPRTGEKLYLTARAFHYFAESFEKIREEQVIAWRSLTEPYRDTFEGGEKECKKS